MEYEVTIKVTVDLSEFHSAATLERIKEYIEDDFHNALFDIDEYNISTIIAEEIK